MNILIINLDKSIFKSGSESLENLKQYSRFFDHLFVITWTLKKESPIIFEDRLFIYPTNSSSRLFYLRDSYNIFKKFLKDKKIDLISSQDPFETGFMAWLLSIIFKIKFHIQIHTDFLSPYFRKESIFNRIRFWIAKFLIPRAVGIRVVSERIKKSLLRVTRYGLQITVLPIFVDAEKIKNTPIKIDLHQKYHQFNFIILMASRFSKEKNIGLAVRVMKDIIREYPKTGLIIVGSGPEEKNLKSQISNLKINENVKIESWTEDLFSYYKTSNLFLLTSNYEGYGRTLVEAAAAGCRIISSDVGIAREILDEENIFKVKDKKDLENKICNAVEDKIKPAKSLKTLTREQYLANYKKTWETCL